jgi:hypothetical protein
MGGGWMGLIFFTNWHFLLDFFRCGKFYPAGLFPGIIFEVLSNGALPWHHFLKQGQIFARFFLCLCIQVFQ